MKVDESLVSKPVEIEIKSWSKLTVHDVLQSDLNAMARTQALGQPAGGVTRALSWANGVVFRNTPFPVTDVVVNEMLEGRLHLTAVEFALCPEFRPMIEVQDLRVTVPLVDSSNNELLVKLADELKARATRPS